MWQSWARAATRWFGDVNRTVRRPRDPAAVSSPTSPPSAVTYHPLECVRITDGVGRTLFEEFSAHRAEARGEEETGWILLGLREERRAVVLATLPAGAQRDAGVSHVRFNSSAQAVGSLIVRQADRRLTMLGVVHTHPGSLRHPSDGDYQGDSRWVRALRGREGVFGIGTADAGRKGQMFSEQPRPHVQTLEELCFSWYALAQGDANYRPLPVSLTIGPDLARPLHAIWPVIEAHAVRLERLYRQLAGVTFAPAEQDGRPGLNITVPLVEPGAAVRAFVTEKEVRYDLLKGGEAYAADHAEARVDRGVFLLLAELAAHD